MKSKMKGKWMIALLALHAMAPCFCARGMDTGLPMPAIFDETIARIRKGEKIPAETIRQCMREYQRYFEALRVENDVDFAWDFLEADRLNYIMAGLKMSIIAPETHLRYSEKWRFGGIFHERLKRMRLADDSTFLLFCSVLSALGKGDDEDVVSTYKELLEKDPFLANHILNIYKDPNGQFRQLVKDLPKPKVK